jgi:hypothetical protein
MIRLKSFTITELIVVMIVSSIVLLLVLWFFERAIESYHKISSGLENSNKTYTFLSRMRREIGHSDYMVYNRNELNLFINDTIFATYKFEKDILVKKTESISDTFPLNVKNIDTTSIYSVISGDYVKSIEFDILGNPNNIKVRFIKEYFSQFLYLIENKQK